MIKSEIKRFNVLMFINLVSGKTTNNKQKSNIKVKVAIGILYKNAFLKSVFFVPKLS